MKKDDLNYMKQQNMNFGTEKSYIMGGLIY